MMDKEKAYALFLQQQSSHQCPGFDCDICKECFEAVFNYAQPKDKELTSGQKAFNEMADEIAVDLGFSKPKANEELDEIQNIIYEEIIVASGDGVVKPSQYIKNCMRAIWAYKESRFK